MGQITYGVLDRASLSAIKDLDKITSELHRLKNILNIKEKYKERVQKLIEDFLAFTDDEKGEYFVIKCGTLTALINSGGLSYEDDKDGDLKSSIKTQKGNFIAKFPVIKKLTPEELDRLITGFQDHDPDTALEQLTPHLVISEEFYQNSVKKILQVASSATKVTSLTIYILIEMSLDCPDINVSDLVPIIIRSRLVNKNHIDLLMKIALERENSSFEELYECFSIADNLYPKSLTHLSGVALKDKNCGDVSQKLRDLAKKHEIQHSQQFSRNLGNLKRGRVPK